MPPQAHPGPQPKRQHVLCGCRAAAAASFLEAVGPLPLQPALRLEAVLVVLLCGCARVNIDTPALPASCMAFVRMTAASGPLQSVNDCSDGAEKHLPHRCLDQKQVLTFVFATGTCSVTILKITWPFVDQSIWVSGRFCKCI